jgi:hypothetical protein
MPWFVGAGKMAHDKRDAVIGHRHDAGRETGRLIG